MVGWSNSDNVMVGGCAMTKGWWWSSFLFFSSSTNYIVLAVN